MKKSSLTLLFSLLVSASVFAGANNADLECRSNDGFTTITGWVPGNFANFTITISHLGKAVRIYDEMVQGTSQSVQNGTMNVIQDLQRGVWTLTSTRTARGNYGTIEMYAFPKSVDYRDIRNGYQASFEGTAMLYFPELDSVRIDTRVSCTLKYQI